MDLLRLPPPLRGSLATHLSLLRTFTTTTSSAPQTLSSYTTALPPSPSQLTFATHFFHASAPTILYASSAFRLIPPSPHPEVAFLGRSNVGKSSLLNALFARPREQPAYVSKRPGRTRSINGFGVSGGSEWGAAPARGEREARWKRFPRGGVVVVDLPGYGAGSREEWGSEVMKFLERRKQLRRCFVLVDAEHGLKKSDVEIMTQFRRSGINFSIILSKVDKVLYAGSRAPGAERLERKRGVLGEMCEGIRQRLDAESGDGRRRGVDILCVSAEKGLERDGRGKKIGVEEVRWAVLSACGIEGEKAGRKVSEEVLVQEDEDEEDMR